MSHDRRKATASLERMNDAEIKAHALAMRYYSQLQPGNTEWKEREQLADDVICSRIMGQQSETASA